MGMSQAESSSGEKNGPHKGKIGQKYKRKKERKKH